MIDREHKGIRRCTVIIKTYWDGNFDQVILINRSNNFYNFKIILFLL